MVNPFEKLLDVVSSPCLPSQKSIGIPVTVSDGLRIKEMQLKIKQLQNLVDGHVRDRDILRADNVHLRKRLEQSHERNEKLQAEVDKIHDRFDILDL